MNNIFSPIFNAETSVTLGTFLICTAAAFICGIIVAAASSVKNRISKSMLVALILLPPIVESVIILVNNNVATGIAVLGAFSLVRFRSVPGKARDIAAIFLSMTAGLACSGGYIAIALIFVLVISAALVILNFIPLGTDGESEVRITVPESLEFEGAFDDLFAEYTSACRLISVKTSNMGSCYKLEYRVRFKDGKRIKEFTDKARCRNGNLEICVCDAPERSEEL